MRGLDAIMASARHGSVPLQAAATAEFGYEPSVAGAGVTDQDEISMSLKNLTSLPPGPARIALVRQLSKSQFLHLLGDCKTQLTRLGLKIQEHPKTGRG